MLRYDVSANLIISVVLLGKKSIYRTISMFCKDQLCSALYTIKKRLNIFISNSSKKKSKIKYSLPGVLQT